MTNDKLQPGDVYAVALATLPTADIDHHNSDLYLRVSQETKAIISRLENKALLSTFRDNNGAAWYELPFCFTPYWENPYKYT